MLFDIVILFEPGEIEIPQTVKSSPIISQPSIVAFCALILIAP